MITFSKLLDEISKFEDQSECACVIASTDMQDTENGDNFIDGSAVKRVEGSAADGNLTVVCSDNGTMTWRQLNSDLASRIRADLRNKPAAVRICYPGYEDFNGKRTSSRNIISCDVDPEMDVILHLELGPEARDGGLDVSKTGGSGRKTPSDVSIKRKALGELVTARKAYTNQISSIMKKYDLFCPKDTEFHKHHIMLKNRNRSISYVAARMVEHLNRMYSAKLLDLTFVDELKTRSEMKEDAV